MDDKEKLKAALRAQLGKSADKLDLDKIVEQTLANTDVANGTEPENGFFLQYQKNDGQYLSVYPPINGGIPVTVEEILEDLERRQIIYSNRVALIEQVRQAKSAPVRISAQREELPNLGNDLSIKVSRNEQEAYLTVPGMLWPDFRKLVDQLLHQENIVYGVLERKLRVIAKLVKKRNVVIRRTLIARGMLPTRGRAARIRYEFDSKKDRTPLKMPDGGVNYYQLDLIKNVRKDQTLVVKYPPGYGEPGITVRGGTVPPLKGRDIQMVPGTNVKITDDGLKMYATDSGHVHAEGSVVSVDTIYTVVGDVDYSTGNIDIDGTLVITGWVRTGFEATASSDIEILGGVEGAMVTSRGGSICIHSGIQGQGRARLTARYDITAFHAENAWLSSRRNIIIKDSLLHSLAVAHNSVQVFAKRGVIIGGVIRARRNILAKQVGGEAGTRTELRIENIEGQALRDELEHIEKKLQQCVNEKRIIERHVLTRFSTQSKVGGQNLNNLDDLLHFSDLDAKIKMYESRRDELKKSLGIPERSNIKIKDVVYPETVLHFGGATLAVKKRYQFATFYYKDGEIKFLPFQE